MRICGIDISGNDTLNCLDYSFWLSTHKKLLGDVWVWAGHIRSHKLDNPDFSESHKINW
ncbi:MAG: hypothetical protein HON90_10640 [Halobacteriovoraceae bacterium]|jgi:fido (protein-threonine AMPylation protein)|nr:hypothetical protein [Halobacteriovoraceae bacterium]